MRYKSGHKLETRRNIVDQAARRFRRDGLSAVGLRPLLTEIGLTHGGFYAHFGSRSDLIAEAVLHALEGTRERLRKAVEEAESGRKHEAFIDAYLNSLHLARPEVGCAGASLAPEISREEGAVRCAFMSGIGAIVDVLCNALPPGGSPEQRVSRAWSVFSMLMGSLQLARAIEEADLSQSILEATIRTAKVLCVRPW